MKMRGELSGKFETWFVVHHVDTEGKEYGGGKTYHSDRTMAGSLAKRAGMGGVHECRVTETSIFVTAKGTFILTPVADADASFKARASALKKLTAAERKALGVDE